MSTLEHAHQENTAESQVINAVAEGGAYEVLRKRLEAQGSTLENETRALNQARLDEFGSSDMSVDARVRVRTENNCIARDIVQVGELLIFGYNVFIGLKKETQVSDVFALFTLNKANDQYDIQEHSIDTSFLSDKRFNTEFLELYRYYKNARLIQLSTKNNMLLMGFQIGERLDDIRVFRWSISSDAKTVEYIDNRGERDIQLPPNYDFEWTTCQRDDVVTGRHSHVNILNSVFIETIGGDLTIKIENNTEDGLGIYREHVEDKTQSIDDAEFAYAQLGQLILIKVLPYREDKWRHFIFNIKNNSVTRIDAIGASCIQLPEDHGVIFPGGYYLQDGEHKTFDQDIEGLLFKRTIRSPNGEDVLFVFYEPESGTIALFAYNMIDKKLQNPIVGHGYALSDSGQLVIFSAETEATRLHPMQIWQTPYISDEHASLTPTSQSFLGKIGNSTLVRGISDLLSISRVISNQSVSINVYEELSKSALKIFDVHYWITEKNSGINSLENIPSTLKEVSITAELAVDEFTKVESIRTQSSKALKEAKLQHKKSIENIRNSSWETTEEYVTALDSLRKHAGHLATIKSYRYIDQEAIVAMEDEMATVKESLSQDTVEFLKTDNALIPYYKKIEILSEDINSAQTIAELMPLVTTIEETASGLDLLSELLSSLKVDDTTIRTRIIEAISEVYAKLNQTKATVTHKQKDLGSKESVAQFSAQFKLFANSITNALAMAQQPEDCDEQMSRLLVQLEELESQFSEHEEFLEDIMSKREEIYESFESQKQRLLDDRARRAQSIADAASRALKSIERRTTKFSDADQLNTYFASDNLVLKIREFVEQLRTLNAAVKADDIDSQFKAIKEQALRILRDKSEIYEGDGAIIKLGPKHRFSVNTQDLDLTILPRDGELNIHLTGTGYFEAINNPRLNELEPYWNITLESESKEVYRAEYLAASILLSAESMNGEVTYEQLSNGLLDEKSLSKIVRDFATPRYKEGYEKGIHDHDASLILKALIPAINAADLLIYDPKSRAIAQVFWVNTIDTSIKKSPDSKSSQLSFETWRERAQSAQHMSTFFANKGAHQLLVNEIILSITQFITVHPIETNELDIQRAADYLVMELGRERTEFITSKYAQQLVDELKRTIDDKGWRQFQTSLEKMKGWPSQRWNLSESWLTALINNKNLHYLTRYIPEAIALINIDHVIDHVIDRRLTQVDLELHVENLMGDHPLIKDRTLSFSVDEFLVRTQHHRSVFVKNYHEYLQTRKEIIQQQRDQLRLSEFKPKPLSSFVRNRLINEAYLPIIGDNLAKQMGTIGDTKRTDLMGLLMMISPPGYGKTTLMEYVASRLGLIFMKINCPSLGHDVMSLDPEQAPNATAKQELVKLNLGLEMGNNVMLYLDDIQHTHPEFLQKFISLCDGTRRIEGIWKNKTKTYDMRGKRFCVVMAGNPYTESGEAFKVPDMLANRADIYNLGDILGGMDEQFAMSYIENTLTSNAVLAPLATRDTSDVYLLIKLAQNKEVPTTDLKHQYSGAEINEMVDVLKKLFVIRDVILNINKQYILSAAQDDKYRTEPSFKLQGSYRNMNKMAEKVSAVMNQDELLTLIQDHYLGESQLLTTGAEENLLKLAELRGNMTDTQTARWNDIKEDFLRNKAMGGDETDTGNKVVGQLVSLVNAIEQLDSSHTTKNEIDKKNTLKDSEQRNITTKLLTQTLDNIKQELRELNIHQSKEKTIEPPNIEVINQPVPGIDKLLKVLAQTIEQSIFPLVRSMDKKLEIDLRTHDKMQDVANQLRELEKEVKSTNAPKPPSRQASKRVTTRPTSQRTHKNPTPKDTNT